ncbi:restriction endonuclease [Aliarcobacter cryaerophilus]|uniref:restriction endonuclease n=1 Tax=Aliarcobacter cryaerophilus TaxID=28198 RepID=UPI00082566CC|nr:DEAD/DEAH box helicase family protein [Aliarcobacter cryaerophilus]
MLFNKYFEDIKNWFDFKNIIESLKFTKNKGDLFENITKYYLIIEPIYKTKFKNVWLLKEVPNDVRKYLNLPDRDEGIDLIAQTKEDEYWAIQCKYRSDESSSIKRDDIATFLDISNNICKNISHKLVCSTASSQSYKFEKFYDNTISFLLSDTWNNLDSDFFDKLNLFTQNKKVIFEPFSPKPHQERAIENALKYFIDEENNRGKLIMACGSGKSLTAYWIANRINAKNIIVAVPSLALIKQTLEVWTRESIANNIEINWLAVCSDDTVSELENDVIISTTKDLGIDVSTDINYITNWLNNKNHHNRTIIFTTYQSGDVITKASQNANFKYDFGIMDEAHKTVGLKDSLFSRLLFDENIFISKRLFMTATERRYKGNSDEIVSMDNIEIYGEDFELLTFKEALETNPPILCDYKIISMMVTKKEIQSLIENNNYLKPQNENYTKEIEAEMLASTVAIHKAIKKYKIKHTISFHSSIERAKFFQSQEIIFRKSFKEYTDLETFHVSGDTPTAKRKKIINDFANADNSLITNARCLTEGVDVPNIDCVLFADAKNSTVDIVQAVGRALRLSKDKEFGYVLVPILIDDENIDIEDIKNKSFQNIIIILRALASSDDRIIDFFDTTEDNERNISKNLIDFDIPLGLKIDIKEFNDAIKLSIIQKIKNLKWRSFEEAREFVRGLNLKSGEEWKLYCKNELKEKELKPDDIPSSPNIVYKLNGWNGMKDWLGTSNDIKFLSFEEAKEYLQKLNIGKNKADWDDYWKKNRIPSFIPIQPEQRYKRNYKNGRFLWKDFLGAFYISFEEAKAFVKKLNLRNYEDWNDYCQGKFPNLPKKPQNIPRDPNLRYRKEWINWEDWLTGQATKIFGEWRPFKEAREFVRSLNLKGQIEWRKYCKGELAGYPAKPEDIPASPSDRYTKEDGWVDYGDWLGTGRKRRGNNVENDDTWLTYEEARNFVHLLKLKDGAQWQQYINNELNLPIKPSNIPNSPNFVYKDSGWISWPDWLGNSSSRKARVKNALSFEEAREFVRNLKLKNTYEWRDYIKGKLNGYEPIPDNIPKSPNIVYKNCGWIGMNDWLGTKH